MEKKRELKEDKPKRPEFQPCGIQLLGGFDPQGYLPNGNPKGSNCIGGMRTWWAHTNPNSEELERVSGQCKCLRLWNGTAQPRAIGASSEKVAIGDGKSKASA